MKKMFIVLALTLSGFNTFAAATTDKFQQLRDLAKQGRPVSFFEVEGLFTGRCYDMVNKNLPLGGVLLVTQLTTNEGPLFPTEKVINAKMSRSPEAIDSLSKEDLLHGLMINRADFSNIVESPLSVVLEHSAISFSTITFFKNQNYIFALTTANLNEKINVTGYEEIPVKRGEVWLACYYYNRK